MVFNDQPRDIYIYMANVRPYVKNASCYFSKFKLCSPIILLEKWFPLHGERAQSLKVYTIRLSVFKKQYYRNEKKEVIR